jgi:hypothetical protein
MANKKISELNSAVNVQDTDLLVIVNGGETRKMTLADFTDAIMNDTAGAEGSCDVATTGNVNLSTGGLLTIDGVALTDGQRVLVWQQTVPADNGIYIAHSGAWTRASDFNSPENILSGSTIAVIQGAQYRKSIFQLTTTGQITVGTTALTIERITGWQFDEALGNVFLSNRSVTVGSRGAGATGVIVGNNSMAQGNAVIASADYSFASGSGTKATAINAHAQGSFTNADGNNSHAEGAETTASGNNAHAEGTGTIAQGINSHAEGNLSRAANTNSHAEGNATTASGESSHAQGAYTTASGAQSHTGGLGDPTKVLGASGIASFNHSFNSAAQTSGFGARGDHSAILGGSGNQVLASALRSVILGGQGITAAEADTAYAKAVRLINYLTINNNTLLTTAKANTIENDGAALFYTDNASTPVRSHLATVENLRVSVPITFSNTFSETGTAGRILEYRVSIGDVANYFPTATSIEAILVADAAMNNSTSFGEVWLHGIDSGNNQAGSSVSVPAGTTSFTLLKSGTFALSVNTTYGIFIKRANASPNGRIDIRSAQLILRPKF